MNLGSFVKQLKGELEQFLEGREIENHLRILLDYYLDIDRANQTLRAKEEVPEEKMKAMMGAVDELKTGKPIDYILNESIFWGFPFYVDENVLIPRPETEELVLLIMDNEDENEDLEVLDIGTGSGCIPIALKYEREKMQIDACDISVEALKVAERNAQSLKVAVHFFELDFINNLPNKKYDIVVSNPPYIEEEEIERLEKNVKEYEPIVALTPFGDPLTFYRRMLEADDKILKPGGRFYWEIHEDFGRETMALFEGEPYEEVELIQDMYARHRMVRAVYVGK